MSTLATWLAASSPDIDVHRVPWPQLATLTQTVHGLREFDAATVVGRVSGTARTVRRTLTSTPLQPDDPDVGLGNLVADVQAFLVDHPQHTATTALQAVLDAATTLLDQPSPLTEWVGDVASEYGAARHGRPEAVLVVPNDRLVAPTLACLEREGLTCVDVATAASLRDQCGHLAAIVLGHPALTYSTAFRTPYVAAREAGWLLTAPPAGRVRLALLTDDPPLTERDVWVWPDATAHPRWQLNVPPRTTAAPAQSTWFVESPPPEAPIVRPRHASDDDVAATAVITASGHTVYFAPDTGAKPRFLGLEDTGDVTISTIAITQLRPGRVLVEHTSGAARNELIARANQWLTDRKDWTPNRIDATRDGCMALKFIVLWAKHQLTKPGLAQELIRTGLSPDYARGLPDRVMDEDYIAPRRTGFDAIVRVGARLDWSGIDRDFIAAARAAADDVPTLRAAHQHAGDMVHRDLRDRLRDRAWEDAVTTNGWALISDDTLGDVLLSTVVVVDGTHPVPRAWLGVPKLQEDR
ncbi:hypothetical protein [Cellulomonas sp. HD19AZ1]|uniref:hypothetical protein n=1 Tax=Cellulomonas sp. HD19AZ1 TaxID=2559593 RepID=UPI0010707B05|nr:hypothetical protein [Cellulomonas sp. HD19AZ1]TFH74079.1 hypothetical protein E4A51_01020 [Cellulomonas sp. HD19AZ1]